MIDSAAQRLAQTETDLATANARHDSAVAHRDQIESRIRGLMARRQGIREDLAGEKLTEKEAAGLVALIDDDLADLREMLGAAQQAIQEVSPVHAQAAYSHALAELQQARSEAELAALQAHVADIESTLTRALAELSAIGIKLGRPRSLSSVWRPSHDLSRAVHHGVAPEVQW